MNPSAFGKESLLCTQRFLKMRGFGVLSATTGWVGIMVTVMSLEDGAAPHPLPDTCSLSKGKEEDLGGSWNPTGGVTGTEREHKPWCALKGHGCRSFPPRKMLKGVDHCQGPKRDTSGPSALDRNGMWLNRPETTLVTEATTSIESQLSQS